MVFIGAQIISLSLVCADVQIQQVVPDTTIAVISTNNVGDMIKNLESAGVCDMMMDVCTTIGGDSYFGDDGQWAEMMNAIGLDKESWTPPSGYAGFAIYPVVDYEIGSVGLGLFGMIELDDSSCGEFFSTQFDSLLTDSGMEFESVNLSGRDVWMIQTDIANQIQSTSFVPSGAFDRAYIVYSDGTILVGTEPDVIATALLALDGDFEKDQLDTNKDFVALVDRCGNEGDVFAGVLLTNLSDSIVQMDQAGMAMMLLPSVKTLFGDVDGIAESVSISPSSEVFVDARYTVLMNDGRSGLIGLLGSNANQEPIPDFVQPEALSYSQGQIDLDKIVDIIKDSAQSNPMLAMQMGKQMEQIEAGLNLFFNPLGSRYHSFSTGQLPYDASTIGYLFAIECADENAFGTALSLTLPMAGAKTSDFLGNQVFSINIGDILPLPMPISLEMSIAVGGGYAFLGTSNTVEEALRSVANPTSRKRIVTANAATSLVPHDDVSSWGYADLRTSFEIQTAMTNAMSEDMFKEMEALDPEMAAEMRKEFEEQSQIQDVITSIMSSLLGELAWNLTADDKGLNARAIMLKPESTQ
jgi:hypothetical protein